MSWREDYSYASSGPPDVRVPAVETWDYVFLILT
jgi:hypothetical protein